MTGLKRAFTCQICAGGMPGAAVVGRREVMQMMEAREGVRRVAQNGLIHVRYEITANDV